MKRVLINRAEFDEYYNEIGVSCDYAPQCGLRLLGNIFKEMATLKYLILHQRHPITTGDSMLAALMEAVQVVVINQHLTMGSKGCQKAALVPHYAFSAPEPKR
jgi:hypothetical protein